jgi:hypothetical protein
MTLFEYHQLPLYYMSESLQQLFKDYKPKEGFKVLANESIHTGNFVACVYKDVPVSRSRREMAEAAVEVISEQTVEKFQSKLDKYLIKR